MINDPIDDLISKIKGEMFKVVEKAIRKYPYLTVEHVTRCLRLTPKPNHDAQRMMKRSKKGK